MKSKNKSICVPRSTRHISRGAVPKSSLTMWVVAALQTTDVAPAMAQQDSAGKFEEIVVTARRREEILQEVPLAITAITPETMKEKNIEEGVDLMYNIPSLTITGSLSSGGGIYNIRGQGGFGVNTTDAVTNYFEDAVALAAGNGIPFFDVESVQVLKGPQGTLFGRNSIGGAVLTYGVKPGREFGGFVQTQLGERNLRDVQFGVDIPLHEKILFRIAGVSNRQDGYTKSLLNGDDLDNRDYEGWRATLVMNPREEMQNIFVYDGFHSSTHGSMPILLNVVDPSVATTFPLSIPAAQRTQMSGAVNLLLSMRRITSAQAQAAQAALTTPAYRNQLLAYEEQSLRDGPRVANPGFAAPVEVDAWGVYNTTTYDFSDRLTLKNVISYQRRDDTSARAADLDATPLPLLDGYNPYGIKDGGRVLYNGGRELEQFTEEIQLSGDSFDDQLEWIVGGFFLKQDPLNYTGTTTVQFKLPPALADLGFDNNPVSSLVKPSERSRALFSQGTWHFDGALEDLSFTAGYRRTWEERGSKRAEFSINNAAISVPALGINPLGLPVGAPYCSLAVTATQTLPPTTPMANCFTSDTAKFQEDSYIVGFDYQLDADTLLYISHRKAFRSGGFNAVPVTPGTETFDPEILKDLELGMKSTWRLTDDIQARVNVALFKSWFDDIQTQTQTVIPNTTRTASVTRNIGKATLEGGELEVGLSFGNGLGVQAFYSLTDGEYKDDINKGRPFVLTPRHTAGATVTYDAPIPDAWGDLIFSVTWYQKDDTSFSINPPSTNPSAVAPGYDLINARISWLNVAGSPVDVSVFGSNLTDEEYLQSVGFVGESTFGFASGYYGPPRTVGAEMRYRFGAH